MRIYSSYFTLKTTRKGTERMHHHDADTDVLQTLCEDSALRSGLTKGSCNWRRTHSSCSILSLDISLLLTKVLSNFTQKWLFYQQFLILSVILNCVYRNDLKFSDRYAWANSADPVQRAVWSGSTLFAIPSAWFGLHYSMVEPHSSNFRVITTNFLGVRIFRKFTVVLCVSFFAGYISL